MSRDRSAATSISGWDIPGSLARVKGSIRSSTAAPSTRRRCPRRSAPAAGASHDAGEVGDDDNKFGVTNFIVDSTTEVLLERMQNIAQLIGVVSLLVALPLLWMAWVLAANLAGLLMLNERRTLGLMRLRGISGQAHGPRPARSASVLGGFGGGLLGLVAGSVVPLLVYERGKLPIEVLLDGRGSWQSSARSC